MTARRRYARRPSSDDIKAMTPTQRAAHAQALVPGLVGGAREHWIETGEGIRDQLARARLANELWNPANSQVR